MIGGLAGVGILSVLIDSYLWHGTLYQTAGAGFWLVMGLVLLLSFTDGSSKKKSGKEKRVTKK